MNRQIVEEASNWFVDFRVGDVDARSRQEFHDWLRRSPEHIQAYLDIAMTYADLPAPNPNGEIDVPALIDHARSTADTNIVPLKVPGSGVSGVSGLPQPTNNSRASNARALAIAASLLLVAIALGSWHYIASDTYSTGIGEQRSLILADGSTVDLNARSRIRVRYTDDERSIDLIEGQALFQVTKNPQRPFIVHVKDTQVRAVGTQFDVYRKASGTIITVIEGRVAVVPDTAIAFDAPGSASHIAITSTPPAAPLKPLDVPAIFLAAGEQLTVSPVAPAKAGIQPKPHTVNPTTATAWTHRQLIFENASLNEVAEEFNRYSTRPIIMETGDFDAFHVSGTYSSTNPESLLRFLRVQPGIKLVESDGEIRIARE